MSSEKWIDARQVFEAALKRDREERDQFLDEACAGNPRLRSEVAVMLAARAATAGYNATPPVDASRHDTPDELIDGRVVGPYIIRRELGRGGMGVVYLADDTRLSRRVALKAISSALGREPSHRERLRQEARAAAALSHPGIATVYALEEFDTELYLSFEYVSGQTLRGLIGAGPVPLAQTVNIARQLAQALAAAHAHGVVHRDLKPENVILTAARVVKVLDFGLARVESLTSSRLTQSGMVVGTPAYMAPEQARGQDIDFRTDLFSFGVILYELTTGTNPFEGSTVTATIAKILEVDPAPVSAVSSSNSRDLDQVVATCLSKRPAERYSSTQALVAALEALETDMAQPDRGDRRQRRDSTAGRDGLPLTPKWWWQFHQLAVSAVYGLMMYPAWLIRGWLPAPWGIISMFVALLCAAGSITLRLHLWFTSRTYPEELTLLRERALPWTRSFDIGFALSQFIAGVAIGDAHPEFATLVLGVSVVLIVASFVIEPTTTKAAFPPKKGDR